MPVRSLFPTRVYTAKLPSGASNSLNTRLLRECRQLAMDDSAGRAWSKTNYPGGYTSYSSASRLHQMSPTFGQLQKRIDVHVRRFAASLDFDLTGRRLTMTDCWVNVMTAGGARPAPASGERQRHVLRAHRTAVQASSSKIELDRYGGAACDLRAARQPGVGHDSRRAGQPGVVRKLAAPRWREPYRGGRISVSFNYSWF